MLKKFTLPKGTLIHVSAAPLELMNDVEVEAHEGSYRLLVKLNMISSGMPSQTGLPDNSPIISCDSDSKKVLSSPAV